MLVCGGNSRISHTHAPPAASALITSHATCCVNTDVKNRRGKQPRNRKITGLSFQPGAEGQLLISSNDSRVRLYEGYALRAKFKGLRNRCQF